MKDNIKRFIGSSLQGLLRSTCQSKLAAVVCAAMLTTGLAHAQVNNNFANATIITNTFGSGGSSIFGSTNADNSGTDLEFPCETNQVVCDDDGLKTVCASFWFKWIAPVEPKKRASPKPNTPPSRATSQYP